MYGVSGCIYTCVVYNTLDLLAFGCAQKRRETDNQGLYLELCIGARELEPMYASRLDLI